MTEHRQPSLLTRWGVRGRVPALRSVLVVLGVLFVIATTLYGLQDNADRNRQQKEIRNTQKCQQELNKLNAQRNLALTKIQTDDRHAVDAWIARVNIDLQVGKYSDISKAYEAYRAERIANDKNRAKYGAGIKITGNACQFQIVPASAAPIPSVHSTHSAQRSSSTQVLPPLPPRETITRTATVSGGTTTIIIRPPRPTDTVRVTSTRTVVRIRDHTRTVTRTRTVTATVTATPTCRIDLVIRALC